MHRLITYMFLIYSLNTLGQGDLSYAQVEDSTYIYYLKKDWQKLIKFGTKAQKNGFNYYYLNLRMGIANFYLNNLFDAEANLKKALTQNQIDSVPYNYLYDINNYIGMYGEKQEFTSTKKTKKPLLNYALMAMGIKVTSHNLIGDTYYGNAGVDIHWNNKTKSYITYSHVSQDSYWGNYNQNELYFNIDRYLKNGWLLTSAVNYVNLRGSNNYSIESLFSSSIFTNANSRTDIETHYNTLTTGDIKSNILIGYIGITKRMNRLNFSLYASGINYFNSFTLQYRENDRIEQRNFVNDVFFDSSIRDSTNISNYKIRDDFHTQFGGSFSYIPSFFQDKLKLSFSPNFLHKNRINSYYKFGVGYTFNDKLSLSYEYTIYNNIIGYLDQKASVFNNSLDKSSNQHNTYINFAFNKKKKLFIIYNLDSRTDFNTEFEYIYNTLIIGLIYNL